MKFTGSEMKEIRYASLLHDFGKVGVREEVLIKARKLYPAQMAVILWPLYFARRTCRSRVQSASSLPDGQRAGGVSQDGCQDSMQELQAGYGELTAT